MSVARIQAAVGIEVARCSVNASKHLDQYMTTGKIIHAMRFDREAEAQQILSHRAGAVQRLAKAWGR